MKGAAIGVRVVKGWVAENVTSLCPFRDLGVRAQDVVREGCGDREAKLFVEGG